MGKPKQGPDNYPGDGPYGTIIQAMLAELKAGTIAFGWAAGHLKRNITSLCTTLVNRHFATIRDKNKQKPFPTHAAWLGVNATSKAMVLSECIKAVNRHTGLGNDGPWSHWKGTHWGHWYGYQQGGTFKESVDKAIWQPPRDEKSKHGPQRTYKLQPVFWPKQSGHPSKWGWNQSHRDVRYVWGWDPKNSGQQNGLYGSHVGFPFRVGKVHYILWVTPKIAFLEGINVGASKTITVQNVNRTGFPKTSTALTDASNHGSFGLWVVTR